MFAKNILTWILEKGILPTDDQDIRVKKIALTLIPLIVGSFAVVWSIISFSIDRPVSASIPMFYAIVSTIGLGYYFSSKKYFFLQYSQLTLLLFLPFCFMWSLGGFSGGAAAMIWAFFTPIAAVFLFERVVALAWFFAYFTLIVISAVIDQTVYDAVNPLIGNDRTLFFLLNMGCASAALYLLVSYAVREEKFAIEQLQKTQLELEGAKEKAETANVVKSQFLSSMSHELRTPLNAIIGFSSVIQEQVFGPIGNDKYQEYLGDIHNSGQHLLELINDILDLSALEEDAIELSDENIDMTKVIEASIRIIQPRAEHGQIKVNSFLEPESLLVYADERRIRQIMINLLSNAVKFTPEGGKVIVDSLLNDDGSLSIFVSDTGYGMNEEEATIALSKFGQVDSGHHHKHEGSGLGLPLTKGLMELHGGTLEIDSLEGYGTMVTATFPKDRVIQNIS